MILARSLRLVTHLLQKKSRDFVEAHEADGIPAIPVHQQMRLFGRGLARPKVRLDQVHRVAVAQRPGQRRQNRAAGEQVTVGIRSDLAQFAFVDRQSQFDPFIVAQFEHEGRVLRARAPLLQVLQELLGNFRKERRSAAVFGVKFPYQSLPLPAVVQAPQDRKITGQQGADIVEKEAAVDSHTLVIRPGWWRMPLWIPDVRGEVPLQPAQTFNPVAGPNIRVRPVVDGFRWHDSAICPAAF